jgi:flagellar basal-body rod protein FlgB
MFITRTEITSMARALARHSAARQAIVSQNIANADTPGHKTRDLTSFAELYRGTDGQGLRATRPGHLGADGRVQTAFLQVAGAQSPGGNGVSIEAEMVKAAEIRQTHDMALAITKSTGSILSTALGRR